METHKLNEARANLSRLVDRALAGEPQRVTRHGRAAVVIASEADWQRSQAPRPTLAEVFMRHAARSPDEPSYEDMLVSVAPLRETRPLGSDFLESE